MPYKTMQQIMVETEKALYQSAGTAVQLYSQDVLLQQIQDAFDHLFTQEWWPDFRVRENRIMNGTTGLPTVAVTSIDRYSDIRYVYRENSDRPLPVLPLDANTLSPIYSTGDIPRYVEGFSSGLFRIWPLTALGNIQVVGRQRPAPYILTNTVKMDSTLVKHFVCWSYFTDDASNPAAAQKHQGLFEARLAQITKDSFNEPITLDNSRDRVPNQWSEGRPY